MMDIRLGVVLLCVVHGVLSDVRLPPSITHQQEKVVDYYSVTSTIKLVCHADGAPEPEYEWHKDGQLWTNYKDVTQTPGSGNLTITSFTYTQVGEYQCFAFNKYGRTMTNKFRLDVANIAKFQSEDPSYMKKKEGLHALFECHKPKSDPPAAISWTTVESLDTGAKSAPLVLDRRVQIDDDGNLVFANVVSEDWYDGWYYRCSAQNTKAGLSAFGSYVQLTVEPDPNRPNYAPTIQAYTGNNEQNGRVVGLKRQSVSLRCLFGGNPTPSVTWSRSDGKTLPRDRINYEQKDTVLVIKDVEDYDEGRYQCQGNGYGASANKVIPLFVEAIPMFLPKKSPKNFNATDGDDVIFYCETDAEPKAQITWYMNSEELTDEKMPPRVTIEKGRTSLRVSKVCKDCKSGATDLRVYACEASNKHGYTFASGYLNVLLPTVISEPPVNYDLTFDEDEITFTCKGTTDDSTPLKASWLRDGERIEYIPDEIYLINDPEGSTLKIVTKKLDQRGREYVGNYTCILYNDYSSVNTTAALNDKPGVIPVKTSTAADLWWVFLIVGILLLLLLLLLCCCICIQRNKGDTYPVDEKERKNGNDPEKELADSGYTDYQRPEEEPVKGSRASLTSAMKLDDSDDDASLAEYGDIDTGKFNEDGSFIGEYNTADRRRGDTKV